MPDKRRYIYDAVIGMAFVTVVWVLVQLRGIDSLLKTRFDRFVEPMTTEFRQGSMTTRIETPRRAGEPVFAWASRHWDSVKVFCALNPGVRISHGTDDDNNVDESGRRDPGRDGANGR